jgi:hypothetical protein
LFVAIFFGAGASIFFFSGLRCGFSSSSTTVLLVFGLGENFLMFSLVLDLVELTAQKIEQYHQWLFVHQDNH